MLLEKRRFLQSPEINNLNNENQKLKNEILQLKNKIKKMKVKPLVQEIKKQEKRLTDAERIRYRKELVDFIINEHEGKIYYKFFSLWGNMYPYWIPDMRNNTSFIKIMSESNAEHDRGHSIRKLTNEEI